MANQRVVDGLLALPILERDLESGHIAALLAQARLIYQHQPPEQWVRVRRDLLDLMSTWRDLALGIETVMWETPPQGKEKTDETD